MVAAKLDQTRVLGTKFRQNWFTLKGRSASQRHTDRQTNAGKNKGPSGLQSGQQTGQQSVAQGKLLLATVAQQVGEKHNSANNKQECMHV